MARYHLWLHIEEESDDGERHHEAHEPVKAATLDDEREALALQATLEAYAQARSHAHRVSRDLREAPTARSHGDLQERTLTAVSAALKAEVAKCIHRKGATDEEASHEALKRFFAGDLPVT